MRYALYHAPPQADPLTLRAEGWLGRSAFTGEALASAPPEGWTAEEIAARTAAARRYGFHATLVAPFALAEGETEAALIDALSAFAQVWAPIPTAPFALGRMGGFFVLAPEPENPELNRLADEAVVAFDRFRAPLPPAERARRASGGLTPRQTENLDRWGYPHVFADFRFHMTLTDRIPEAEAPRMRKALEARFGDLLAQPRAVASVALFREAEPGGPFLIRAFRAFGPPPAPPLRPSEAP